MVSARDDGFTTDASLNIKVIFQRKPFGLLSIKFTFSIKNEDEGSLLLSEINKAVWNERTSREF